MGPEPRVASVRSPTSNGSAQDKRLAKAMKRAQQLPPLAAVSESMLAPPPVAAVGISTATSIEVKLQRLSSQPHSP